LKKRVLIIIIAACAIVFGISAYQLITYYGADKASENAFAGLLPDDIGSPDATTDAGGAFGYEAMLPYYEQLRAQNGDMVGWLRIPGTRISYPVMQTPNSPEYYIDRNFQQEYSTSGTLFASSICDVDLPSDVVTIYGHRMKTGAMFGSLGDFLDADFFSARQTIIFDTFTARNEYRIYGVFVEAVNTGTDFMYYRYNQFADESMFNDFMKGIKDNLVIENPDFTPKFGDQMLLLSTCEYTHDDGRLVLVAVRVQPSA